LRVRLYGRCCTAVCTVRRMDARQMRTAADSGCDENVPQMCERSNYGFCWLQRKSWHCGDARVMDLLLGPMHCWRWSGESHIPVCPSVGRKLSGRSLTTGLLGSLDAHLRGLGVLRPNGRANAVAEWESFRSFVSRRSRCCRGRRPPSSPDYSGTEIPPGRIANHGQKYILSTSPNALTCRLGAVPVSF